MHIWHIMRYFHFMRTTFPLIAAMVLLTGGSLLAQAPSPAEKAQAIQSIVDGNVAFRSFNAPFSGVVKGNVKLFESYLPGNLLMQGGRAVRAEIDYDALSHEVLVLRGGKEFVVPTTALSGFVVKSEDGDSIRFQRVHDEKGNFDFYQVIEDGPNGALYKRTLKRLIDPEQPGPYQTGRDYAEIVTEVDYLASLPSATPQLIRRKKDLTSIFDRHRDALSDYLGSEKLSLKEEKDLCKLFRYLNSL